MNTLTLTGRDVPRLELAWPDLVELVARDRGLLAMRMPDTTERSLILRGLPVREQGLDVNGVPTMVLKGGHGPSLLLLHGGIECGGAYWAPLLTRLAQDYELVIPDFPGLGESDPVRRLDLVAFEDWLTALISQTCKQEPTLVAHSLLGTMAARFAALHSDVLRRLVVYAAPGVGPYRMPLGLRLVAIRFALRPSKSNAERFDRWAFVDYDKARLTDPAWYDAFSGYTRARAAVPHIKRTMRQLIRSCTKQVSETELRRITVPTTLLWGRHDRFVPLDLATRASSRLAWPLHVIDDAGHAAHIERPEAFLAALAGAMQWPGRDDSPRSR